MGKFIDLTGQRFGRLTVIERYSGNSKLLTPWLCLCSCGSVTHVASGNLRSGNTQSCGCKATESRSRRKVDTALSPAEWLVFVDYRRSAKKNNREFRISENRFLSLLYKSCVYCGAEPRYHDLGRKKSARGGYSIIRNGIDRIDSSLGYTDENCITCCSDCNEMKMDRTHQEFLEHIERIHNYQAALRGNYQRDTVGNQ